MRLETRKLLSNISKTKAPEFSGLVANAYDPAKLLISLQSIDCGYADNQPVAAAHFAFFNNGYSDFCTGFNRRVIEITDFYYNGISDTAYGDRPFEVFILNKTFDKISVGCHNFTRNMLLDDCSPWSPYLRELIIDTCNFILRGRRDIDIVMLRTLAIDYANAKADDRPTIFPDLNVERHFEWSEIENMTSAQFFTAWLSRKRGADDLLCAHQIMLGV